MPRRWGFLGASRIGRTALAPAIRSLPGQALHAIASRDLARARAYATDLGFRAAAASYEDVVESADIDVVYIALINDAHLEWTLRALQAGKDVLCEKPMVLGAADAATLAAAERRTGRRVMEAFCHLHHPQIPRVAAILANTDGAEAIGHVRAIDACHCLTLADPADYRWHARHGGGALLDLGCYIVSLSRHLLGREPVRVAARQSRRGEVDVTTTGMLDFGADVCVRFACSMAAATAQNLDILGATGRLRLDRPIATKGRQTSLVINGTVETFSASDPYVAMVAHFLDRLATGAPFLHGADASVGQAAVLDALRRAADRGTWEDVAKP